jgi:hypothetical protein
VRVVVVDSERIEIQHFGQLVAVMGAELVVAKVVEGETESV